MPITIEQDPNARLNLLRGYVPKPQSKPANTGALKAIDGDTFEDASGQRIRHELIDAPESNQIFGKESTDFATSNLAVDKKPTIDYSGNTDKHGRQLGQLSNTDGDYAKQAVGAGLSWVYEDYCTSEPVCSELKALQQDAKVNALGLWQDKDPIKPSDWRRMPPEAQKAAYEAAQQRLAEAKQAAQATPTPENTQKVQAAEEVAQFTSQLVLAPEYQVPTPVQFAQQSQFKAPLSGMQGAIKPGTLDPMQPRALVKNDDGSVSTIRTISVGTDAGEVLIPTVSIDGRIMSDDEAVAEYQKSGLHYGVFTTPDEATAYAKALSRNHANMLQMQPDEVKSRMGQQRQTIKFEQDLETRLNMGGVAGANALGTYDAGIENVKKEVATASVDPEYINPAFLDRGDVYTQLGDAQRTNLVLGGALTDQDETYLEYRMLELKDRMEQEPDNEQLVDAWNMYAQVLGNYYYRRDEEADYRKQYPDSSDSDIQNLLRLYFNRAEVDPSAAAYMQQRQAGYQQTAFKRIQDMTWAERQTARNSAAIYMTQEYFTEFLGIDRLVGYETGDIGAGVGSMLVSGGAMSGISAAAQLLGKLKFALNIKKAIPVSMGFAGAEGYLTDNWFEQKRVEDPEKATLWTLGQIGLGIGSGMLLEDATDRLVRRGVKWALHSPVMQNFAPGILSGKIKGGWAMYKALNGRATPEELIGLHDELNSQLMQGELDPTRQTQFAAALDAAQAAKIADRKTGELIWDPAGTDPAEILSRHTAAEQQRELDRTAKIQASQAAQHAADVAAKEQKSLWTEGISQAKKVEEKLAAARQADRQERLIKEQANAERNIQKKYDRWRKANPAEAEARIAEDQAARAAKQQAEEARRAAKQQVKEVKRVQTEAEAAAKRAEADKILAAAPSPEEVATAKRQQAASQAFEAAEREVHSLVWGNGDVNFVKAVQEHAPVVQGLLKQIRERALRLAPGMREGRGALESASRYVMLKQVDPNGVLLRDPGILDKLLDEQRPITSQEFEGMARGIVERDVENTFKAFERDALPALAAVKGADSPHTHLGFQVQREAERQATLAKQIIAQQNDPSLWPKLDVNQHPELMNLIRDWSDEAYGPIGRDLSYFTGVAKAKVMERLAKQAKTVDTYGLYATKGNKLTGAYQMPLQSDKQRILGHINQLYRKPVSTAAKALGGLPKHFISSDMRSATGIRAALGRLRHISEQQALDIHVEIQKNPHAHMRRLAELLELSEDETVGTIRSLDRQALATEELRALPIADRRNIDFSGLPRPTDAFNQGPLNTSALRAMMFMDATGYARRNPGAVPEKIKHRLGQAYLANTVSKDDLAAMHDWVSNPDLLSHIDDAIAAGKQSADVDAMSEIVVQRLNAARTAGSTAEADKLENLAIALDGEGPGAQRLTPELIDTLRGIQEDLYLNTTTGSLLQKYREVWANMGDDVSKSPKPSFEAFRDYAATTGVDFTEAQARSAYNEMSTMYDELVRGTISGAKATDASHVARAAAAADVTAWYKHNILGLTPIRGDKIKYASNRQVLTAKAAVSQYIDDLRISDNARGKLKSYFENRVKQHQRNGSTAIESINKALDDFEKLSLKKAEAGFPALAEKLGMTPEDREAFMRNFFGEDVDPDITRARFKMQDEKTGQIRAATRSVPAAPTAPTDIQEQLRLARLHRLDHRDLESQARIRDQLKAESDNAKATTRIDAKFDEYGKLLPKDPKETLADTRMHEISRLRQMAKGNPELEQEIAEMFFVPEHNMNLESVVTEADVTPGQAGNQRRIRGDVDASAMNSVPKWRTAQYTADDIYSAAERMQDIKAGKPGTDWDYSQIAKAQQSGKFDGLSQEQIDTIILNEQFEKRLAAKLSRITGHKGDIAAQLSDPRVHEVIATDRALQEQAELLIDTPYEEGHINMAAAFAGDLNGKNYLQQSLYKSRAARLRDFYRAGFAKRMDPDILAEMYQNDPQDALEWVQARLENQLIASDRVDLADTVADTVRIEATDDALQVRMPDEIRELVGDTWMDEMLLDSAEQGIDSPARQLHFEKMLDVTHEFLDRAKLDKPSLTAGGKELNAFSLDIVRPQDLIELTATPTFLNTKKWKSPANLRGGQDAAPPVNLASRPHSSTLTGAIAERLKLPTAEFKVTADQAEALATLHDQTLDAMRELTEEAYARSEAISRMASQQRTSYDTWKARSASLMDSLIFARHTLLVKAIEETLVDGAVRADTLKAYQDINIDLRSTTTTVNSLDYALSALHHEYFNIIERPQVTKGAAGPQFNADPNASVDALAGMPQARMGGRAQSQAKVNQAVKALEEVQELEMAGISQTRTQLNARDPREALPTIRAVAERYIDVLKLNRTIRTEAETAAKRLQEMEN